MADYNNKLLGIVRIRQHRMPENSCPNRDLASEMDTTCVSEFNSKEYLYKKDFREGWQSPVFYEIEFNRVEDFWWYGSGGTPITGEFHGHKELKNSIHIILVKSECLIYYI